MISDHASRILSANRLAKPNTCQRLSIEPKPPSRSLISPANRKTHYGLPLPVRGTVKPGGEATVTVTSARSNSEQGAPNAVGPVGPAAGGPCEEALTVELRGPGASQFGLDDYIRAARAPGPPA